MSAIKPAVREYLLTEVLPGESPENLKDDTALIGTGILDSLGTLNLALFLETTFGIKFSPEELDADNLGNLDRIEKFVERKRSE